MFAPLSVGLIRSLGGSHSYRIGGLLGTGLLTVSCIGSSFVKQPEWLFLTHSLLYGAGSSLVYMASSLVIGDHFRKDHKYHVLATSILLCGYPLGRPFHSIFSFIIVVIIISAFKASVYCILLEC